MTLKRSVKDIEEVEEQYRELYVEVPGKGYRLDAESDDYTEVKGALQKERARADAAEKAVGELTKFRESLEAKLDGKDIDEILAKSADAGGGGVDVEARIKAEVQKVVAKYESQVKEERQARQEAEQRYGQSFLQERARKALTGKVRDDAIELALPAVMAGLRPIANASGSFDVAVYDGDTKQLTVDKGSPRDMSPEEYVDQLIETRLAAVAAGPVTTGGGATQQGSNGGSGAAHAVRTKADLVDAKAKSAFITDRGMNAYLDLPDGKPAQQ